MDTAKFKRRVPFEQVETSPWIVYGDASLGWLGLVAYDSESGEKLQLSTPSMLAAFKERILV